MADKDSRAGKRYDTPQASTQARAFRTPPGTWTLTESGPTCTSVTGVPGFSTAPTSTACRARAWSNAPRSMTRIDSAAGAVQIYLAR